MHNHFGDIMNNYFINLTIPYKFIVPLCKQNHCMKNNNIFQNKAQYSWTMRTAKQSIQKEGKLLNQHFMKAVTGIASFLKLHNKVHILTYSYNCNLLIMHEYINFTITFLASNAT